MASAEKTCCHSLVVKAFKYEGFSSILGMVKYYQKFIAGFAILAQLLFYLLKKEVKFFWLVEFSEAFYALQKQLAKAPVLRYPDFNKGFIFQTNALLVAVGAVFRQIEDNGKEHLVLYCSWVLDKHKKNTDTERECLSVICACKQFYVYIYGTKFKVITDHALLRWLANLKKPEG